LITFRTPDATPAVIIGLDPMIQNPLRLDPGHLRKLNEISALLDCRVKPGNDGKAGARPGRAESALNRTAVGLTRQSSLGIKNLGTGYPSQTRA
jgi:hypothetical protein